MIFSLVNLFLIMVLFGLVIYLIVRSVQQNNKVDTVVAEIKSKIGSMIKDLNNMNMQEYKVDLQQSADIATLKQRVTQPQ
jgi:hypothetical protein